MSDLGAINVKFGADLSDLTAGFTSAKGQATSFASSTSQAMSDVAAAQEKAAQSSKQLAESQQQEGDSAQQAAQKEQELASANKEAASASDGFSFSLGGMIGKVMDFGSRLGMAVIGVQGLIQGATSLASGLLGPGIAAEEVSSSLQVFTGSAKKAQQELQQLSDFASHTPFETQAIDDAALKLQGVGISAQDVIPDIKALGDGLDAMGRVSSADLAMIVDSFMKIKTQGHLTTDVMNSFALQGIDAWSVLEKQTGKTHAELAALISKGLYPANQAMHDLTVGIEANPLYKGQMANDSATFTGALSTLKSNFDQVLASFDSPILKAIEPLMSKLGTAFSSPGFKNFAGTLGHDLVSTLTQIGQIGKSLFGDINLGDFANVGDKIHQVFITIQKDLSVINPNDLKAGLSDLFSILSSGDQIIGTITGDLATFASGILDAANKSGVVQDVLSAVKDILPDVGNFLSTVGSDMNDNLLPPLESLITNVGSAVGRFAEWMDKSGTAHNLLSNLGDIIGTVSSDVGTLVGWIADLIGWFTSGGPQTYILVGAVTALGLAFAGMKIADTVSGFATMFNKLKEGDGIVANLAGSFKDKIGKAIDDLLSKQFPNLKQGLDDIKTKSGETGKAVEGIGTSATTAEGEVASASAKEKTEIGAVGTAASTTATDEAKIGTAATTAETEVAAASTKEEAEIGAVGAAANTTAVDEAKIGTAATESETEVALASTKEEGELTAVGLKASEAAADTHGIGAASVAADAEGEPAIAGLIGKLSWALGLLGGVVQLGMWLRDNNIVPTAGNWGGSQQSQWITHGHAMGGSNLPTGKSWVGENGPEIIDVPGGSNIYNNAMSRMMTGGSSSPAVQPIHNHFHVYLDGQEMTNIVMQHAASQILSHGPVQAVL